MKRPILALTAITLATSVANTSAFATSKDDGRIEVGYLTCELTDSTNVVVISEQQYSCVFDGATDADTDEKYTLNVIKYGVDLSITENEQLRWAVLAPASFDRHGVLEGSYSGISADAALGYAIGAKALFGGFEESVALQPLSVTKGEGLGAAVGVESATLTYNGLTS